MGRKFFVGGNWKMNGDKASIDPIIAFLKDGPGQGISGLYEGIQKVRLGSRVKMTISLVSQLSTSLTVKSFRIIWNSG